MKIHLVQLNWFIDGIKGLDKPKRVLGNDCVVIVADECDIGLVAEAVVDSMGQGGTATDFHTINSNEFSYAAKFVSMYWGYDNVENFGLVDWSVIQCFNKNEITNKAVLEAIEKEAYYWA